MGAVALLTLHGEPGVTPRMPQLANRLSPASSPASSLASRLSALSPHVLSLVRIVVGLLFLEHGMSRLFGWPSPMAPPEFLALYWWSGAIELTGGALLTVGFLSRPAALIMSGEMAFAYFLSHAPKAFFPILNGGDSAILYCFIFFYFVFAGPGPWSIDAWLRGRADRSSSPAFRSSRVHAPAE